MLSSISFTDEVVISSPIKDLAVGLNSTRVSYTAQPLT